MHCMSELEAVKLSKKSVKFVIALNTKYNKTTSKTDSQQYTTSGFKFLGNTGVLLKRCVSSRAIFQSFKQ